MINEFRIFDFQGPNIFYNDCSISVIFGIRCCHAFKFVEFFKYEKLKFTGYNFQRFIIDYYNYEY